MVETYIKMHKKTLVENLALCDISMTLFYHSIIAIDLTIKQAHCRRVYYRLFWFAHYKSRGVNYAFLNVIKRS